MLWPGNLVSIHLSQASVLSKCIKLLFSTEAAFGLSDAML